MPTSPEDDHFFTVKKCSFLADDDIFTLKKDHPPEEGGF